MIELDPDRETNPMSVADTIGILVSEGLRDGSINLYSAFLLNQEALRLQRRARAEPAWGVVLSISGLLGLYMQRLVALATREERVSATVATWLKEEAPTLTDRRAHYLVAQIIADPCGVPSRELLEELSEVRANYAGLSDDDGPYHTEVFPYFDFEPEVVLLSDPGWVPFTDSDLAPEVEQLLIKLATGKWAS